jgi:hypothetical protein
MPTQARTEHGRYRFRVKEGAEGNPWIAAEPQGEEMPCLKHAFIGFQLPDRTALAQAERIADYLNQNLTGMSITMFEQHPMLGRG